MSEQIDQILHDKDSMYIAEEEEGDGPTFYIWLMW